MAAVPQKYIHVECVEEEEEDKHSIRLQRLQIRSLSAGAALVTELGSQKSNLIAACITYAAFRPF